MACLATGKTQCTRQDCCLTPRSRRGPTAGHQARATGTVYIFCGPGLAPHRWSRLTSNVRPRKTSRAVLQQNQRLSAWTQQPRRGAPEETLSRTSPRGIVSPCGQSGRHKDGRLPVGATLVRLTTAMTGNRRATSKRRTTWEGCHDLQSVHWAAAASTDASARCQASRRHDCVSPSSSARSGRPPRQGTRNNTGLTCSGSLPVGRGLTPCIFRIEYSDFLTGVPLNAVVEGCGQVGRGWRGGQRAALSTASRPVRAQLELSTCPQPRAAALFAVDAPNLIPLGDPKLVTEHLVNASARLVQPCSPNSCQ